MTRMTEPSGPYRHDYKKIKHDRELKTILKHTLFLLANDYPLPPSARDHALRGAWSGYRECHIRPDLLLIYKKPDAETLRLARICSHSELFG